MHNYIVSSEALMRLAEEVNRRFKEGGRREHICAYDHAILMLLATYGLRAGELVKLRLEDIDWRRDGTCQRL